MMLASGVVAMFLVALATRGLAQDDDFLYDVFPDGFLWSSATSAYQIEGAWNDSGKGENIWDRWCHEGNRVANNDTGDVACDSYNKYQEDTQLLSDMGVQMYRFSIAWSRILPTGELPVNPAGVQHYVDLVDALVAAGIEPVVTLYHWDLPQPLQDKYGGWLNESVIEHFVDYARTCFQGLGDKVKWWITFNEPWVVTTLGYETGAFAPGINDIPGYGAYQTAHNIIKAHAQTWHMYNEEFRPTQDGNISITLDSDWKEPLNNEPENLDAAERAMQFKLGWFAHPIFVNGDYPELMKSQVLKKSQENNLTTSRLPEFTEEEKELIKGTFDFFGLNHYTTQLISDNTGPSDPSYFNDQETIEEQDSEWPGSGSDWLKVVPWGLRKLLNFIRVNYDNPPVLITENGFSDNDGNLDDQGRINYYRLYINNALKANKLDNCSLIGYTAWSLMDNFEWAAGYTQKFGLHYINFSDPTRARTPKASVAFYKQVILDNGFPEPLSGSPSSFINRS